MTEEVLGREQAGRPERRLRSDWPRRLAKELLAFFVGVLVLLAGGLVLLDTAPGHRFIVDRLGQFETASGLNIRIGRIEGSVFGNSKLKNVAVSDPRGVFLTSPEIELDWAPLAWLYNSLHIDRLSARQVRLHRVPKLKPTGRRGPILPGFDIHIGEFEIQRLELARAVTGQERAGRVRGSADVRAGRAMVDLGVAVDGGDRIAFSLDAEPDRDRFDLDARVRSPGTACFRHWSARVGRSTLRSRATAVGAGGAAAQRSTCPAGRRHAWVSGWMQAAIAWRELSLPRTS